MTVFKRAVRLYGESTNCVSLLAWKAESDDDDDVEGEGQRTKPCCVCAVKLWFETRRKYPRINNGVPEQGVRNRVQRGGGRTVRSKPRAKTDKG